MKAILIYATFVISASSVLLAPKAACQTDSSAEKVIRKLPFSITSPGEYELAQDLSISTNNAAIKVTDTANVIIDLNGHTLTNTASVGIGISIEGSDFVTIKNGTIYGFGFGVKFDSNSENTVVRKVTFANESLGVDTAADKSTIEGCFMSGTGAGSGIALAPGTSGVLAKNNQIDGFSYGIQSAVGSESKYNYNRISSCNVGLYVSSKDEYSGNVFTACSIDIQPAN
jgi:Right handed beta helix region